MSELSDRRKLIRTLKDIKNNLSYEFDKDYRKIYSECVEVENEYGGYELTDYIQDSDFVDEDDVKFLLERYESDLDRLRCFIGNTYSSGMYKLDGYGNLDNVSSGDMENLCDDLIDIVRRQILSLKQSEL